MNSDYLEVFEFSNFEENVEKEDLKNKDVEDSKILLDSAQFIYSIGSLASFIKNDIRSNYFGKIKTPPPEYFIS